MSGKRSSSREAKNTFDIDLNECKYLGHGRNGRVYLMPDGRALKICRSEDSCRHEYEIYKIAERNKYFPKAFKIKGNCMIRDYVDGTNIRDYIKKNGLSEMLALNIIDLLDSFIKLKFTRIDIRLPHVFVRSDESLIIIDPRATFTKKVPYPRHLFNGLEDLRVMREFMTILRQTRPDLYRKWH